MIQDVGCMYCDFLFEGVFLILYLYLSLKLFYFQVHPEDPETLILKGLAREDLRSLQNGEVVRMSAQKNSDIHVYIFGIKTKLTLYFDVESNSARFNGFSQGL